MNPIAADDHRRSGTAFRYFRPTIPFNGYALFRSRHLNSPLIDGFLAVERDEPADDEMPA